MWSWVLATVGLIGLLFVGRKTRYGWLILLINETLWITYAVQTKQYGFILGSLVIMVICIKSYRNWSKDGP